MKRFLTYTLIVTACTLAVPFPLAAHNHNKAYTRRDVQPPARFHKGVRPIAGQYVVVLKNDHSPSGVASVARSLTLKHGGEVKYLYQYALKGFALQASEASAVAMSRDPRVEYVEESVEVKVAGVQQPIQTTSSTFWGLDRIDQRDRPLDATYHYNRVGSGVHVYVIDTGIRLSQREFGTRATAVFDFARSPSDPSFGYDSANHGTYVAGVIGGRTYGVAKNVLLHSVRVQAGPTGGNTQDLINGINHVAANHIKPAVANISLATYNVCTTTAVDTAVQNLISSGVTVVVGAGDQEAEATCTSPAHVGAAITVGSSTSTDSRTPGTSGGAVVDLFAPGGGGGQFIPTASNSSDVGLEGFTATSAAAPHVTGVVAQYLESYSLDSPNDPATLPGNVSSAIVNNATVGRLNGLEICRYNPKIDDFICTNRSPNLLLYSRFVNPPSTNPVDNTRFYTRQQYYDFLRRTPDGPGWDGWTNYINACGANAVCIEERRVGTVRGFIESSEFLSSHPVLTSNPVGSQAYNEEYVRQLYRCMLQREPDQAGFNMQMNYINAHPGDYSGLVREFVNSDEYRLRFF